MSPRDFYLEYLADLGAFSANTGVHYCLTCDLPYATWYATPEARFFGFPAGRCHECAEKALNTRDAA